MPTHLGDTPLPRLSPHFLRLRTAVRAHRTEHEVLIGLSGGADSLSLLAAAAAEGQPLSAVIVDHQLQEDSAVVAAHAQAAARRLGVRAQVVKVDVDTRAGQGVEAAAREARYHALSSAAGQREVWVAHTANDQAETLLLGALRGNPAGMLPRSRHASGVMLVRPLLEVTREDTTGACAELGFDPWQDPHNTDPAFRRAALRTQLIPHLSEIIGGDPVRPLARTAARIAEDNALLEELAGGPVTAETELECAALAAVPAPLRRRRIAAWLHAHTLASKAATLDALEALCVDYRGQGAVAVGTFAGRRLEVARIGGRLALSSQALKKGAPHSHAGNQRL